MKKMSRLYWAILLVLVGQTFGRVKPAVRVRVTQKCLDYAIDRAMEYAQAKLENYPLPDAKGKLSSFIFDVNYAFTNMSIYNITISSKSLRPVPSKGLYTVLKNVDFDIKGNWKISLANLFSNSGSFTVKVQDMSVAVLIDLGVNGDRLAVSSIICASKLETIDSDLKSGQATSFLFSWIKGAMNNFVKSKIPDIACKEGKKAIRKQLNEQFAKFPVKQHLKKSVTLDYSVVKKPEYKIDAVDLFLKGDFQPSDGNMTWLHQPAALPRDNSRDRMIYVTIMDHMINSAGHAYYNQDAMRVQVTVKQTPQILPKTGLLGRYFSRINTGLGLIKSSACSKCDFHISMAATSPPQIKTSRSGIHLTVHAIAEISVVLPGNIKQWVNLETNVTATAIPILNGTNLNTKISDLKIITRVTNQSLYTALPGRIPEMKRIVKEQIEKLLENGISAMEIPLPLSETFQLAKPKITYGEGYMTLETDVSVI